MRVTNPAPPLLDSSLGLLLEEVRGQRGFAASEYLDGKARLLNEYIAQYHLAACVVALSGGVDSSVVLGIAAHAAKQPGSPIRRIVPVMAPILTDAATNQEEALVRGEEVAHSLGLEGAVVDLTAAHQAIKESVDRAVGIHGEGWASGQLVAYTRTPAFYYVTSLLTQEGTAAVLLGTTNRDEGAYLGYVGKAADGMVDLQLIADLHKSEVYRLAELIELPESVINVTPTGDMFDGRVDEDVFGAPYNFVELYLNWLCCDHAEREAMLDGLTPVAWLQFQELGARLEKLHSYNAHKYLAASPAIHLNLLASAVPGGWSE